MKRALLLFTLTALFIVPLSAQNSWLKKAFYGGAKRERAVGFSIGNKGYIGTGQDTANLMRDDFWEYDPVADTWTQKATFPGGARRDAIGFSNATKGYLGTGMDNASSAFGNTLNDLWEYDPVGNTWTQKNDYPGNFNFGIYYATTFCIGNKGYLCCGKQGNSNYSNELWEYDMINDQWQLKANFPGGVRYGMTAFSVGSKGYVGMGADENVFCNDLWEYDPNFNNWTKKANFPASARFNCSGFTISNIGYVCLGTDGGYKDELFAYDPSNNSWTQKASFGGGTRRSAAGFVINSKGYLGTGKGPSGCSQGFWEYTPGIQGVEEKERGVSVSVYPNPMHSSTTIRFMNAGNYAGKELDLLICDMKGAEVRKEKIRAGADFLFSRADLAAGTYTYRLLDKEQVLTSGKLQAE